MLKVCLLAALTCCAVFDPIFPGWPEVGMALAGSSSTSLAVSLTIIAGCSVRNRAGTTPVNVACDNAVPYRVEVHPGVIEVTPESALIGNHRHAEARNIVILY
jgi:hypothetical protein